MKGNTILKFNCCMCNCKVEIQTVMEAKRVLKICNNCWVKYTKKQSKEYIPFVEEYGG